MNARPSAFDDQETPADPAREAADSAACLHCGVCCFSRLETYVRVTGDDWTRLGPAGRRAVVDAAKARRPLPIGQGGAVKPKWR